MAEPRQVVTTLAMSLDGYIADPTGGYGWISGDGDHHLDTPEKWDFTRFLEGVDLVLMGRGCYDQGQHKDFAGKQVWVATHTPPVGDDQPNLRFVSGDLPALLRAERQQPGKDIYIYGGGVLLQQLAAADVIDRYIIGIVPVLLHNGRRLFPGGAAATPSRLKLEQIVSEEGIVILYYQRQA